MAQENLGSGIHFPIQTDHTGGLEMAAFEEKVKESIRTILSTAKGERVMRPDFGCDLQAYVFATCDTTNATLIKSAVREALVRWEPRIEVQNVSVSLDPSREAVLQVRVDYKIRATNIGANLVYPFYLQSEQR